MSRRVQPINGGDPSREFPLLSLQLEFYPGGWKIHAVPGSGGAPVITLLYRGGVEFMYGQGQRVALDQKRSGTDVVHVAMCEDDQGYLLGIIAQLSKISH
jgi:hypothetical protein